MCKSVITASFRNKDCICNKCYYKMIYMHKNIRMHEILSEFQNCLGVTKTPFPQPGASCHHLLNLPQFVCSISRLMPSVKGPGTEVPLFTI